MIAREGYSGATVKQLADAVGLSQNGLLHYFGSKDALFTEILRFQDDRNVVDIDPEHSDFAADLVERILIAVDHETASPGMPQLMLRLTGDATESDHPAHEFFRYRYEAIRRIVVSAVEELRARGEVPDDADPQRIAALVYAAWDGLRTQRMFDPEIDVRENMTYLLQRLGLLAR
ncbi:TetR/AcrR family transcriptional regulator [Agromyces mangrovi Wang et al. 2018]|uniref:TetR/AcrR family transcriptional regulator n=1 Tax=Agromyces mangrovi TaxID=1858653 RepID=UPI0025730BAB|nr:TetR/AcrR family transcriptional regulator [Agromyces mangrovi]